MKNITLIAVISLVLSSTASAQSSITISDLLEQGYNIVAASSRSGESAQAFVFLQKRSSAFMCLTAATGSRCFSLNDHNN